MAKKFVVSARLEAEDRASRVIGKVEGRFKRLGNFLKSRFVITLGDITRGISGMVRGFTSLIEAANEQEDAIKKLDASLKSLGPSAASVSEALQAQASALQKVTRFGDETIIKGQALLATFSKNEAELKRATVAALDLSAATGVDLNAAFLLLGKAAVGETATLSRYGIILDEGIPKSEKFAAVLDKLNTQFGGQAQAEANTFRGVMQQVSNAFGDLKETAGEAITKNDAIRESLKRLTDLLADPRTVEAIDNFAVFFTKITETTIAFVGKFRDAVKVIDDWRNSTAAANIPMADFQAQADRMGISVLELRRRVAEAQRENQRLEKSTRELAEATEAAAAEVDGLTAAQKRSIRIEKELDALRSGAKETLEALGLTLKGDLVASLEANKQKLSELMELERQGLLTREQAAEGARQLAVEEEALQAVLDGTASSVDAYNARLDETVTAQEGVARAAGEASRGVGGFRRETVALSSGLRDVATQAAFTTSQFDALAAASGRAAATQAAIAGGGRTVLGGRRVLIRGGSRLTFPPGFTSPPSAIRFGGTLADRTTNPASGGRG